MSAALASVLAVTAEEGRNIILSMLVVGLIFLAVIGLGELNSWRAHRRTLRRQGTRTIR